MSHLQHKNRSRKVRKDSKTIPVPGHQDYGDGEDADKWYECWHCGFKCNVERDELGGKDDDSKVTPTAFTDVDQYGDTAYHCYGAAGATQTICEAAGGTWTSTLYKPVVNVGCPFCGTLNWMGKY